MPSRLPYIGGATFTLNPGPFNMKVSLLHMGLIAPCRLAMSVDGRLLSLRLRQEHAMIVMMSDLSNTQAYALGAITAGEIFYEFTFSVG